MTKTNNFVLDTNALVSAFLLSQNSISARAYYKAKATGTIVFSVDTFNEFSDVFVRRKFDKYLTVNKRLNIIEDLKSIGSFVNITNSTTVCRDPKDDKYLQLAISCGATCVVTGGNDLLALNPFEGIPILTPADFMAKH